MPPSSAPVVPAPSADAPHLALADLRRGGAVTELLILYECATGQPTRLRPIAQRLGLTVQAVSSSLRHLAELGRAEVREGRYRPTVAGVEWLHRCLGGLREDLDRRLGHLYVVRSTRAIALTRLEADAPVSLEMVDGVLSARPGSSGSSRGRAVRSARAGAIVDVADLEGIVPIPRGSVHLLTVPMGGSSDPRVETALRRELARAGPGLLAAQGLEAVHLLHRCTDRPVVRFAVGAACAEASRLGVSSTVLLPSEELPRLLDQLGEQDPPPLEVTRLEPLRRGPEGAARADHSGAGRSSPSRRRSSLRSPTRTAPRPTRPR